MLEGFDIRFARSPVMPVVEQFEAFLAGTTSWDQLFETMEASHHHLLNTLDEGATDADMAAYLEQSLELLSTLAELVEAEEFQAAAEVVHQMIALEEQLAGEEEGLVSRLEGELDEESLHELLLERHTEEELTTSNFTRMEECVNKLVQFGEPRPLERALNDMRQLLADCRQHYSQLEQPKSWTNETFLGDRLLAEAFDEWSKALDFLTVGHRERSDEMLGQGLELFWSANRKLVMVQYLSVNNPSP